MKNGIIKDLVTKYPSHKVNKENYGGLWPFIVDSDRKSYRCLYGYKLIGWTDAPFTGNGPHAIIFEYDNDIVWNHGDADLMIFNIQTKNEI